MLDAQPTMLRVRVQLAVMGAITLAAVAGLLTIHSLAQAVSVEEQTAIAAGAVTARSGVWPVTGYPYFEMPMWPLMLAGLFTWCDELLLGSRLVSVAAATGCAGLLMWAALRRLHALSTLGKFALAGIAAVLLVCSPLYVNATGCALPGDVAAMSMVLSVLAGFAAMKASGRWQATAWAAACGVACGLATALWPMYAPASAVLLLLLPCGPAISAGRRATLLLSAVAGAAAAMAPTAWLLSQHSGMVWFATSELPLGRWLSSSSWDAGEALASPAQRATLEALGREPLMWVPLAAFALLVVLAGVLAQRGGPVKRPPRTLLEIVIVVLAAGVTAVAGYVSTPAGPAQLFAAMPLVVLATVLCAAYVRGCGGERIRVTATTVYIGAGLAVIVPGMQEWSQRGSRFQWSSSPVALHRAAAQELGATVLGGHVLTLRPALALEAGAKVYLPLMPGEASWRWSSSMSGEQCESLGLITPSQLGPMVRQTPPTAVVLGRHPSTAEQPLRSFVRHHRYHSRRLLAGETLWVPYTVIAGATAHVQP